MSENNQSGFYATIFSEEKFLSGLGISPHLKYIIGKKLTFNIKTQTTFLSLKLFSATTAVIET